MKENNRTISTKIQRLDKNIVFAIIKSAKSPAPILLG